jgi:hypothetical protein
MLLGMELMGCQGLAVPGHVMHYVVQVESAYNPYAIDLGSLLRSSIQKTDLKKSAPGYRQANRSHTQVASSNRRDVRKSDRRLSLKHKHPGSPV